MDGCDVSCAKTILGYAEIPMKGYLVLTGLGIEKNRDFIVKKEEVRKVKEAIRKACSESAWLSAGAGPTTCCGCVN